MKSEDSKIMGLLEGYLNESKEAVKQARTLLGIELTHPGSHVDCYDEYWSDLKMYLEQAATIEVLIERIKYDLNGD